MLSRTPSACFFEMRYCTTSYHLDDIFTSGWVQHGRTSCGADTSTADKFNDDKWPAQYVDPYFDPSQEADRCFGFNRTHPVTERVSIGVASTHGAEKAEISPSLEQVPDQARTPHIGHVPRCIRRHPLRSPILLSKPNYLRTSGTKFSSGPESSIE